MWKIEDFLSKWREGPESNTKDEKDPINAILSKVSYFDSGPHLPPGHTHSYYRIASMVSQVLLNARPLIMKIFIFLQVFGVREALPNISFYANFLDLALPASDVAAFSYMCICVFYRHDSKDTSDS